VAIDSGKYKAFDVLLMASSYSAAGLPVWSGVTAELLTSMRTRTGCSPIGTERLKNSPEDHGLHC
jgi:hypothetical protein